MVSLKEAYAIGKELGFSDEDVTSYKSQFDACDEDDGGSISSTELKTVMRACGMSMTDAEVERLVKKFDTDGTGDLDFGEFLHMMHDFQQGPSEVEVRRAMFEVRCGAAAAAACILCLLCSQRARHRAATGA